MDRKCDRMMENVDASIREGEPNSLNSCGLGPKVLGWKQGKGEYSLLQEIRPTKIH